MEKTQVDFKDKKVAMRFHAFKRYKQRYNENLDPSLYSTFKKCIIEDENVDGWEAKLIVKQSQRVSLFSIKKKEKEIFACFDFKRKEFSTFLLKEMIYDDYVIKNRTAKMITTLSGEKIFCNY